MSRLEVVGVRHHSPACARLVRERIATLRPAFVLIEGPLDLTPRLPDLLLPHTPPIAAYSYRLALDGSRAWGSWTPFCGHSPEWVAATEGARSGAVVKFVDLPGWHRRFDEMPNRYADGPLRGTARLPELARRFGHDTWDALWDHLFEVPRPLDQLREQLSAFFHELRGDDPPFPGDDERERTMAQFAAHALAAERGPVLLVCGGYHAPAIQALATALPAVEPVIEVPPERIGTYLVPYSFHRLDAFTGYRSGLPSPAWYDAIAADPEHGYELVVAEALREVRAKGVSASPADHAAARTMIEGLARLRGHAAPTRVDVLDGLVSALVKEALPAPLPWHTGAVAPGTHPAVVALVAAFSGARVGTLARGTPQPPLVADVREELANHGLAFGPVPFEVEVRLPDDAARRHRLVRLELLGVPDVKRVREADHTRGATRPERWRLQETLDTDPVLIERASWGATLAEAARAAIVARISTSTSAVDAARALALAARAGFPDLAAATAERAAAAIESEPSLAAAGGALDVLLGLAGEGGLDGGLSAVAAERTVWLLEAEVGPTRPLALDEVGAVAALRRALDVGALAGAAAEVALAALGRVAGSSEAPPALAGAALGAAWGLEPSVPSAARAAAARTPDAVLGDWLGGLFALAREVMRDGELVGVVDARIRQLDEHAFLVALPTLRRAFGFFPPRERQAIARELLRRAGVATDVTAFLAAPTHAPVPAAAAFDAALTAVLGRYRVAS